ncbi:cell division protein ZapA [Rubeoparvulum massiliense]|uniref:cell division protein ZapA n=1 Tax=Rubeoparvulum massiliense TaxID=1631346 RepID=UPI00065DDF6C|nr:cell division protein ZapA [Rubeoparvulum massiliense]
MHEQAKKVTVDIFGQQYHIRGDVSSNYIRMIASTVDDQMKRLASANPRLDSLQLAVLTAVNFADQYEQLKREYDDLLNQMERLKRHSKLPIEQGVREEST